MFPGFTMDGYILVVWLRWLCVLWNLLWFLDCVGFYRNFGCGVISLLFRGGVVVCFVCLVGLLEFTLFLGVKLRLLVLLLWYFC